MLEGTLTFLGISHFTFSWVLLKTIPGKIGLCAKLIGTLRVYNPYFRLIYLETSQKVIFDRRRADIKASVLERMIQQLDVPVVGEAHRVEYA